VVEVLPLVPAAVLLHVRAGVLVSSLLVSFFTVLYRGLYLTVQGLDGLPNSGALEKIIDDSVSVAETP
jgi:hypothetical protein